MRNVCNRSSRIISGNYYGFFGWLGDCFARVPRKGCQPVVRSNFGMAEEKLSTEEFRKLQLSYINSRWPNTSSEDHPKLCKGAGNADIALSVARLAVDEDLDRSDDEEKYDTDSISRQWI